MPPLATPGELDPPVRHQYDRVREAVDRLSKDPSTDRARLGRAFGELGMWYHGYGYPETAAICYRNAELLERGERRWPYYLGLLLLAGKPAEAAAAFERARALSPEDVPTLLHLGEAALALGRLPEAESHFRAVLTRDAAHPAAAAGLGAIAIARKDDKEAVRLLEPVLARQPEATKVHQWLGLAYRRLGDMKRAEEHLAAVPADPLAQVQVRWLDPLLVDLQRTLDGAKIHRRRAQAAARSGDHDLAIREHRLAVASNPSDMTMKLGLGRALVAAKRGPEAVETITEVVKQAPDDPRAHLWLGRALLLTKDRAEAETHLRRSLELDANQPEAWTILGSLLASSERLEEALDAYDKALSVKPDIESTRARRDLLLLKLERYDRALRELEADLSLDPDSDAISMLLARLLASSPLAEQRNPQRAFDLALAARKKTAEQTDADVLGDIIAASVSVQEAETLAMAYAAKQDFARAVAWQRAALAAIERRHPGKAARWAERRLALYEAGKPCRQPLEKSEVLLHRVFVSPPDTPSGRKEAPQGEATSQE